ncbi:MAG TPA: PilC/PilY family type IV pilus protein [Rubrivivax sp.]|nr:PilC/PilY family type IV pilus protein [Rubrivivax sp.]
MKRMCLATQLRTGSLCAAALAALVTTAHAATPLADQPVFSTVSVPGNLALALSVEYPTAVSVAHTASYSSASTYLGYFDPNKCYLYSYNATEALRHFYPAGAAVSRVCTGGDDTKWSGNFLNWATMQTIDPFRWALTGGYRSTDTATETILEKAYASGQGGTGNFGNRTLGTNAEVAEATPLTWGGLAMRVQGLGNKMRFTRHLSNVDAAPTSYDPAVAVNRDTVYEVNVRVKVCDSSAGAGPLEANCTLYPAGNYKPTGLIQQYADQIRYSAFGYLNDSNLFRDGGVLRAKQKFVGPTQPVPGSTPVTNAAAEWDASNGVMTLNPDATDASDTSTLFGVTVNNSGVMNYLNKFGQVTPGSYKTYDPVGELYYAALRYFKKLGNVPEYTSMTGQSTATKTTWIDGFPVITSWNDPIQYSCQKNFILGIGDVNTHADRNLPGATGSSEPSKPALVTADTTVDALVATNKVGTLHGIGNIGSTQGYGGCCNHNGALMAGLAYDANAKDIRPDDANDMTRTKGRQTVQTYWLDILEYSTYKANNQFYLAAKYGGFNVPETFDPYARGTDIPAAWWNTTADTVGGQPRPDTYYTASRPDQMVLGLTKAFASIASKLKSYTTSFSTSLPQVATSGVASYATQFDAKAWSGEMVASTSTLDEQTGAPALTEAWRFSAKLDAQAAGTGWDTGRRIATFNTGATPGGVPFRAASISSTQLTALDTSFRSGDDSADYLNYLRGDRTHERSSAATGSARAYRDRASLLGDIVGSKARPVGRPDAPYSDAANAGYAAFKAAQAARKTMVYAGTNQGMLHAVDGSLTGGTAGQEVFAYVPGALYNANGLKRLGDPDFVHFNLVDATPAVADVDFGKTQGGTGTNWRTILVGGLGKGGRSLYAIDVTDPSAMTDETAVAGKVLWEFSHSKLGYTYGEPAIVKTKKYGWVVIAGSGYNNDDGKGYFFILNPRNGDLLATIGTGAGSTSDDAGLAHVQAFLLDRTDGTADTVYAGDLHGSVWRLDMTGTGSYPAPEKIASLTDSSGVRLPVTSRPLVIVQPQTNKRFVTIGTGRLLHSSDIGSAQAQRFFAIVDGTGVRFRRAGDAPTSITFPVTTSKLEQLTDLTQEVSIDYSTKIGWFVDLGQVAGGPGWRVISDATSFLGVVAFTAMVPSTDSACEPSGTSRVYAIDLGNGKSRLRTTANAVAPYLSTLPGVVTDLRFYSVAGKPRLLAGTDTGATGAMPGDWAPGMTLRRLNWREVPLAD